MTHRFSTIFAAALLALALPSLASAQTTERPFYVGGGLGAAIELDRYPTQLMVAEEIGYHLFGTTDGLFLGGAFAQSFGSDIATLQFGARVGYDIPALRSGDLSILLAPSVAPGVVVAVASANTPFGRVSGSDAGFNLQGAFDVKILLLDEQLELFARPFAIDVFIDDGAAVRWNALVGATARL